MTIEQAKKELVKRYKYLYENAEFILAPYMIQDKDGDIYLDIDDALYNLLEEFLVGEDPMEQSLLYILQEDNKTDSEYLKAVKEGLVLVEKKNKDLKYLKESLNMYNLLHKLCSHIDEQSGDLENKKNKLYVIDQYFRIIRYQNDGKVYTSGRELTLHDCPSGISIPLNKFVPSRPISDIGTLSNKFITAIVNAPYYKENWSIFTEEEKQEIYLQYHDELPYYLYTTCVLEEEYIPTMIESRLQRPDGTKPCHETFRIDESQIFINPNDKLYRYYQMCPHCGYIVNIPKEILSDGIKERIEARSVQDKNLFRKNMLKSELFALENKGPKRTLK
jgi:hypothetical protein